MGWSNKIKKIKIGKDKGIKIGCWNKGGALQPLRDKTNEIEILLKSNNFGVLGIVEANFFKENEEKDVQISGYRIFWDKGRDDATRRNSRCIVYVRNDLSTKVRQDLMKNDFPEIWIEIGEENRRRSLLCIFYQEFSEWNQRISTNSLKNQKERFARWLSYVGEELEKEKEIWLLGDFNLDLKRKDDPY